MCESCTTEMPCWGERKGRAYRSPVVSPHHQVLFGVWAEHAYGRYKDSKWTPVKLLLRLELAGRTVADRANASLVHTLPENAKVGHSSPLTASNIAVCLVAQPPHSCTAVL